MAKQALLLPSGFDFLNKLKKNNNREWFNAHKDAFLKEAAIVEDFIESYTKANTPDIGWRVMTLAVDVQGARVEVHRR